MKKQFAMKGLTALALILMIAPAALADTIRRNVTLQPGGEVVQISDLEQNDTLQLTLINPTDRPMTFQTSARMGMENAWVVPARSTRVVTYVHQNEFTEDVQYMVMDDQANVVSQGTLISAGDAQAGQVQPVSERQPSAQSQQNQQTQSDAMQPAGAQPGDEELPPQPAAEQAPAQENGANVRGYW